MQCKLAISQCNEVDQVGCIIINATEVKKAMLAVGRSACNPRIRIIAPVSDMDVHHTHFHIFLPYNHTFICTLSQYSLYLLVLPPCTRLLSLIHFLLFPLWTHPSPLPFYIWTHPMLCSSWTNPQMTASLQWELGLLHNFNPSKNRLTLMVGELTCKTEDWTKQRRPRSQPSPQFKPPPPLYLESAPHLLKILKMDFFAHSLLISSLSWHLDFLTTPHMGTILSDLQDLSFTLPVSTTVCLLSHEGRQKTARADFLKM